MSSLITSKNFRSIAKSPMMSSAVVSGESVPNILYQNSVSDDPYFQSEFTGVPHFSTFDSPSGYEDDPLIGCLSRRETFRMLTGRVIDAVSTGTYFHGSMR